MPRHSVRQLTDFARGLLAAAGLDSDKAVAAAEILVEGELLGHTTHGVNLLAPYLEEIEKGGMARSGEPAVLTDHPAAVTWDGRRLPGPWLTRRAIALASERARRLGTGTVVIRRSHHTACLAAYLKPVADEGLMIVLSASDPTLAIVAPHGGSRGAYSPNPIAAAWPTDGDPVIIDVSLSTTAFGAARRLAAEGRRFPGAWALDAAGAPTDDPAAVTAEPRGALLPIGGADHGHKGYALGLLMEALTSGLAGCGRAAVGEGWAASVFVQVLDPKLFGGGEAFGIETSHVAAVCRATPPRAGFDRVRLPGEAALRRRKEQLAAGIDVAPAVLAALKLWADKLGVAMPA